MLHTQSNEEQQRDLLMQLTDNTLNCEETTATLRGLMYHYSLYQIQAGMDAFVSPEDAVQELFTLKVLIESIERNKNLAISE